MTGLMVIGVVGLVLFLAIMIEGGKRVRQVHLDERAERVDPPPLVVRRNPPHDQDQT